MVTLPGEPLVRLSRCRVHKLSTSDLSVRQNRHEMLTIEPLSQLLDEKWDRFARYIFAFYFLSYLVYLFIFTLLAYNKKGGEVACTPLSPPYPTGNDQLSADKTPPKL